MYFVLFYIITIATAVTVLFLYFSVQCSRSVNIFMFVYFYMPALNGELKNKEEEFGCEGRPIAVLQE